MPTLPSSHWGCFYPLSQDGSRPMDTKMGVMTAAMLGYNSLFFMAQLKLNLNITSVFAHHLLTSEEKWMLIPTILWPDSYSLFSKSPHEYFLWLLRTILFTTVTQTVFTKKPFTWKNICESVGGGCRGWKARGILHLNHSRTNCFSSSVQLSGGNDLLAG